MNQSNRSSSKSDSAADYSTVGQSSNPPKSVSELTSKIEAILFVSAAPVPIHQLASALDVTPSAIESSLTELDHQLQNRGLRLQQMERSIQLTTAPEIASDIQRFLQLDDTARLSRAALEALAIIAYQQPVTRPQIDSVRGVNSDSVLRNLLRHGLIEEVGRSDGPGRPFLYSTTAEFLSHFGLRSLSDLPPLNLDEEIDISGLFSGNPPDRPDVNDE